MITPGNKKTIRRKFVSYYNKRDVISGVGYYYKPRNV